MNTQTGQLDCEQLIALWNINGKPFDVEPLVPTIQRASPEVIVQFLSTLRNVERLVTGNAFIDTLPLPNDEERWLRYIVASDPTTPVEVLTHLSTNEWWTIRKRTASNPNTPIEVLTRLATDEEWPVRQGVAENPNTPVDVLKQLIDRGDDDDDYEDMTVERAQENLDSRGGRTEP